MYDDNTDALFVSPLFSPFAGRVHFGYCFLFVLIYMVHRHYKNDVGQSPGGGYGCGCGGFCLLCDCICLFGQKGYAP
jgi:hypothetical protein